MPSLSHDSLTSNSLQIDIIVCSRGEFSPFSILETAVFTMPILSPNSLWLKLSAILNFLIRLPKLLSSVKSSKKIS